MANPTTTTTAWTRLAAPDRHVPKRPVTGALFPFGPHRPASTIHDHAAAVAAGSAI
jgi:hypothetical protein